MRSSVFVALLIVLFPTFAHAAVIINEIAWMGTNVSANAEWIELFNTNSTAADLSGWHFVAASGSPSITLTGSIGANGFYLLERTSDASVPTVTADQIYTGALANTGTTLTLTDANGKTIDEVAGGANWVNVGGDNASKETAQRTTSGWETAAATPRATNVGVSIGSSTGDSGGNTTATSTATGATSGTSSVATTTAATSTDAASTSNATVNTASGSSGGPAELLPIPMLRIFAGGNRTVSSGADIAFSAVVYDGKGNKRDDAMVTWSFGDGMRRTGASIYHSYFDPGEYLAVVHVSTPDGGDALNEMVVTVKDASIKITSVSPRGIGVMNRDSRTLDLSMWRLSEGGSEFKIPPDTQILAGHSILFSSRVIELPVTNSASLLYPNGDVAATFPETTEVATAATTPSVSDVPASGAASLDRQLSGPAERSNTVQAVTPIINTKINIQKNEEAVDAPREIPATPISRGAASSSAQTAGVASAPASNSRGSGIFRSPWTLGLLGVIATAGGAFILL
jgi:hypothetical protein